jgi:hypothetical protein
VEGNKDTILLVFAPVFDVAPNVTYANTLCLARLEDQLKSGAMLAYLFPSTGRIHANLILLSKSALCSKI